MTTIIYRTVIAAVALLSALAMMALPAAAETFSCHIGKPSYCAKYGALCLKWNNASNKPAACEKWTVGCFDCHNEIPSCLGNHRPPSGNPLCTSCGQKWLACMHKNDRRHWTNRMSGPPDDNHDKGGT